MLIIFCVVDFYVIIVGFLDLVELMDVMWEVIVVYMVVGIDLKKLIIFN